MKILSIAGRNLNSLRVEFKVDFTSGILKDCGIFAITGPTGAGKTTLLDALTLALYGRTPRSAADEDIISYGAVEAWAEVIFQTSEGCFKCEWKVRRARSKHNGALQQSVMEVSIYPEGKILTHKKREALDKVRELLKLEYDQFLKSVLLAQGAFKAFLDAKEGERGDMLEKISDTSLYTQLSKRAFERKKKEELVLDFLRAKVGNLVLLTEAERTTNANKINSLQDHRKKLQQDFEELQIKYNWLRTLGEHTQNLLQAAAEVERCKQTLEQERPSLQRWEAHQLVAGLEQQWLQCQSKKEEIVARQQNIITLQSKLSSLSANLQEAEGVHLIACRSLDTAVKRREERMPFILEAITRKSYLQLEKRQLDMLRQKQGAKMQESTDCQIKISQNITTLANDQKNLSELEIWLNEHPQYAEAGNSCTRASLLVSELKRSMEDIELLGSSVLKAEEQIALARKEILVAKNDEQQAGKDRQSLEQLRDATSLQLSKLKSQLKTRAQENNLLLETIVNQAAVQQNELSRQEFLAEHLSILHLGEPCPLCGSTEHPNQTLSDTEVLTKISLIQAELKQRQELIRAGRPAQQTIEKLLANLDEIPESENTGMGAAPQNFEELFDGLMRLQKSIPEKLHAASLLEASAKERIRGLTEKMVDLNGANADTIKTLARFKDGLVLQVQHLNKIAGQYNLTFDEKVPAKLPGILKTYSNEYHEKAKDESVLRRTIPGLQAGVEILNRQVRVIQQDLSQLSEEINNKNELVQKYSEEIKLAHEGYVSPEVARDRLTADEKSGNEQVAGSAELVNQLKQEREKMQGEKHYAETMHLELRGTIEALITSLKAGLVELGLHEDLQLIGQRLLGGDERVTLGNLSRSLQEKLVIAAAYEETCKNQLNDQRSLQLTEEDANSVEGKMQEIGEWLQATNQELGQLQQILTEDGAKQDNMRAVKKEIEFQEKTLEKWAALSALIGAENGRKFNLFAQGLTLDRLIVVSNHHLQLLNDRYLLKRNTTDQGLRLTIIDLYQADNEREINTLSGGESFLVSLALALGLSEMTSKLTTIDSLFIDEGFGTLDADTLEVALSALRGLQIGGKMIGIISHVERLKEEIYAQVEITKGADGFSTLKVIPEIF